MGKGIFPEAASAAPSPWKVEVIISQRGLPLEFSVGGSTGWGVVTVRYPSMVEKKVIQGGRNWGGGIAT